MNLSKSLSALAGRITSIPPARLLLAGAVLAVAASFILYRPVLGQGFSPTISRDDELNFQAVQPYGLSRPWVYFHPHFWPEHRSRLWVYYRPIEFLSYAADFTFWGMRPPLSRCVNLLLHCLNAVLLAALAYALLQLRQASRRGALPVSAMTASLFLILPASAEPVSWIASRGDLLSTAFSLACALTLITWARTGRARWAALSVASALLALGTKETSVTLPLLAGAGALFLKQRSRQARLTVCLALFSCLAGYVLFRTCTGIFSAPPNVGGNSTRSIHLFAQYLSAPATTVFEAIAVKSFWRLDIQGLAQIAASVLLLLPCIAPAAAALAWKAAFYVPVFSFGIVEPRYLYLPSVGTTALIALVCWQAYLLCRRTAPHLAPLPIIAWGWIAALYLHQLESNIGAFTIRALHR